jgi:hypothetical protein
MAVPGRSFSDMPVDFRSEGDSNEIGPDRLFPVEEVIRGVIFFYENGLLPDWMNWKVWNPITREWEFRPKDEV